jgi:hypothetical protein
MPENLRATREALSRFAENVAIYQNEAVELTRYVDQIEAWMREAHIQPPAPRAIATLLPRPSDFEAPKSTGIEC